MQKSIIKDKFPAECQNKTKNRYDTYNHTGVFPDLDYHYYIEESFAVDATTKQVVPRLGSPLTDPVYVRPEDFGKWLNREKQVAQDFLHLLSEAGFDSKDWTITGQKIYQDYKFKNNFRLQHKEDSTRHVTIREDIETKGTKKHPITTSKYRITASSPYVLGDEKRVIYDDFWLQSSTKEYARFNFRCEKDQLKETLIHLNDVMSTAADKLGLKTMSEIKALGEHGMAKCEGFADTNRTYVNYFYDEEHNRYQLMRDRYDGRDPFDGRLIWFSDQPGDVYCEISLRQLMNYEPFTQSEYRYAVEKQGLTYQEPGEVWNVSAVRFKLPDTKEERVAFKQTVAMAEVAIRDTLYEIKNMSNKERREFQVTLKQAQETTQLDVSDLNQLTQGQER